MLLGELIDVVIDLTFPWFVDLFSVSLAVHLNELLKSCIFDFFGHKQEFT